MDTHATYSRIAGIIAGSMLLFALGTWPYAFYQLLRIVVCFSAFYLVWHFSRIKLYWLSWMFIIPGIFLNPLLPIYMAKSTWQVLDVIFSLIFFASLTVNNSNTSH